MVDDNPEIRAYVRAHLEDSYRVDEAPDGRRALERARARVPDLIVSDVAMPEMDGIELLGAVHDDPELAYVPVILLTARAQLDDRLEGLESGADAYLAKPFQPRELTARIANLIAQRKRLRDRLALDAAASGPATGGSAAAPGSGDGSEPTLESRVRAAAAAALGDEDFGVEELAAAVFMERTGLYRHMMEEKGTSPSALLREMRLARAAARLGEGSHTVLEVAYAVGYRSVSSFSRRFSERFACSPAAWPGPHPPLAGS